MLLLTLLCTSVLLLFEAYSDVYLSQFQQQKSRTSLTMQKEVLLESEFFGHRLFYLQLVKFLFRKDSHYLFLKEKFKILYAKTFNNFFPHATSYTKRKAWVMGIFTMIWQSKHI